MVLTVQRGHLKTAETFAIEQQQRRGSSHQHIHENCIQTAPLEHAQNDDDAHEGYQHPLSHTHHFDGHDNCLHSRPRISVRKAGTSLHHEDPISLSFAHPEHLSRAVHALLQSRTASSNATYMRLLRACTNSRSLSHAKQISAHLVGQDILLDGLLGDYLVVSLATCGAIDDALNILGTLKHGTVYSWTAIISACVKCGCGHDALKIFNRMQDDGVEPNQATFVSLFQACSSILDLEQGRKLHVDAHHRGFLSNLFVGNCLISMYIKCGTIRKAQDVFMELPHRDVVSWNTMLSAFADQGQAEKALQLYRQMREEGEDPDHLTIMSTLQACSSLAEAQKKYAGATAMPLEIGLALHAEARKRSWTGNIVIETALMYLYGKCGLVSLAEGVFWGSSHRDTVVWNSMLAAYLEQGDGEKALHSYVVMQKECPTLDEVTCMYGLQACGELGSSEICNQIHFTIVFSGCDRVHSMAAALIQAYRCCASMLDAHAFFHALSSPDYVTWTACVAGHAGDGNFVRSLHMFEHLQFAGIEPDEILFTAVLSACSHVGLVVEGLQYFHSLRIHYGKRPHLKHYAIMLDLLGRAGNFKEMDMILEQMPMQADLSIWLSLLGACRMHGHVKLARRVFQHVVGLEPDQAFAYILMANIYIDAGLQDCAAEVEIARHKQGLGARLMQNFLDDELYTYF